VRQYIFWSKHILEAGVKTDIIPPRFFYCVFAWNCQPVAYQVSIKRMCVCCR
jgi:hypothetical protein